MARQRVTLADVAARAGVSASTASLAFSGAGPVASATRDRVLAAATELGYAGPDPLARSLRQRRSGVVGVVITERLRNAFRDPVAVALLDGLSEELAALGSALLLLPDSTRTPPEPASPAADDRLAHVPLDALAFATCGAEDDPLVGQALIRGVPVVGVEGPHRPDVPLVDLAQHAGAEATARHLAGLGHRRVAVVALPLRLDGRRGPVEAAREAAASFSVPRTRLAGTRSGLDPAAAGRLRVVEAATNLVEEGERAAAGLLAAPDRPTAVIAQSDLLAIGVIRAAARAGLRVPADLSVAGFDGIDTAAWLPDLRLTTVEQPMTEKGHLAGRMVAELLAGRRPADVTLPVTLRPGDTTGPAPPGP